MLLAKSPRVLVGEFFHDSVLELFHVTPQQILRHRRQTTPSRGPWTPWEQLDQNVVMMDAGITRAGRLDIFSVNLANELRHQWPNAIDSWGHNTETLDT